MSTYLTRVIRWPLKIETGSNDVLGLVNGISNTSVQLTADFYVIDGSGNTAPAPGDFLAELVTQLNTGMSLLGATGTITASLDTDGILTLARTGGSDPADTLEISWGTSTFDRTWIGEDAATTKTIITGAGVTLPLPCQFQWLPKVPDVHDDGGLPRMLAAESKDKSGRPTRVTTSTQSFHPRTIVWDRVASGVMWNQRADDTDFAAYVGLSVGSRATWEELYYYLLGESIEDSAWAGFDNPVWIYDVNDTSVSTDRRGPYEVCLDSSMPGLAGPQQGSYFPGDRVEKYPVKIEFWTDTSA